MIRGECEMRKTKMYIVTMIILVGVQAMLLTACGKR